MPLSANSAAGKAFICSATAWETMCFGARFKH